MLIEYGLMTAPSLYRTYASLYPVPGHIQTYYNQLAYLSITLNNESIQQLIDICGDRDAWRDGLAEYGVTHEVTIHDQSVPDNDDSLPK